MNILEIIVLVAASLFALSWVFGIRSYVSSGQGITKQTVNTTMLFLFSIVLVLIMGWSSLNLLWMLPVSWLLGTLSLSFPFSLLWIFGKYFALLCVIGLKQK